MQGNGVAIAEIFQLITNMLSACASIVESAMGPSSVVCVCARGVFDVADISSLCANKFHSSVSFVGDRWGQANDNSTHR